MPLPNRDFGIKVAQFVGIGLSAYASGFTASITLLPLPSLLLPTCPPALAAQQWATIYDIGKRIGPVMGLVSLSAFAYLSYSSSSRGKAIAYALAGAMSAGVMPWTLGVMMPTNNKLYAHAEGKGVEEEDVGALLRKWGRLNLVRSVFPGVGAGIALGTVVGLFE